MKTFRIISAFLAAAVLTVATPATAGAAIVHASAAAGARGHILKWALDYDTVTSDVTINVTHTKFDGSPAIGAPQVASLVVIRPNGQERAFDFLTLVASTDGQPGIINKGVQTYTNVPIRVSASRANLISFRTDYTPPLGA